MTLSRKDKHDGIIGVFLGYVFSVVDLFIPKIKESLGNNLDSEEDRIYGYINIMQDLPEDEYGGFIEEYFSINLTLICYNDGKCVVYTDVDPSHVHKDVIKPLENYIDTQISGKQIKKANYGPFSYETPKISAEKAIELARYIYNILEGATVSKDLVSFN